MVSRCWRLPRLTVHALGTLATLTTLAALRRLSALPRLESLGHLGRLATEGGSPWRGMSCNDRCSNRGGWRRIARAGREDGRFGRRKRRFVRSGTDGG